MSDVLVAELLDAIPEGLRGMSGGVFYSGLDAWSGSRPVYLLGYNPGGKPGTDTVYGQAETLLRTEPGDFSEYVHREWVVRGHRYDAGQAPMQLRVRYLLGRLGLDPGAVPASNIIYARSSRAADLSRTDARSWPEACWPFHQRMIQRLGVEVVVCFGGKAASFVRRNLKANHKVDEFTETYADRSYTSATYSGPGPTVVHLTHPGTVDWRAPEADPTGLAVRALLAAST